MAIENIQILGAILELPSKQHCQFSLFSAKSKTAPRISIFSMAMGADYSFELISTETYAPQFIGHNKFFLESVYCIDLKIVN